MQCISFKIITARRQPRCLGSRQVAIPYGALEMKMHVFKNLLWEKWVRILKFMQTCAYACTNSLFQAISMIKTMTEGAWSHRKRPYVLAAAHPLIHLQPGINIFNACLVPHNPYGASGKEDCVQSNRRIHLWEFYFEIDLEYKDMQSVIFTQVRDI